MEVGLKETVGRQGRLGEVRERGIGLLESWTRGGKIEELGRWCLVFQISAGPDSQA